MAGVARRPSTIRAAGTESERGMSPVHIDELTPETRARVLKQIEETEAGTTALAVIEPKNHPSVQKPSSQLAKLEQARQMLAESRTLSEVKQVRDIAEAARVYAKAANLGHDAQNYAAEIALLAARKAGDILKQLEKSKGGEPTKKKNSTAASVAGVESEYAKTLKETGTPERTAQRWQKIAAIPQETFTEYIESVKPADDITAAGLLKAAKLPHAPKLDTPHKPSHPVQSSCPKCEKLFESRSQLKKHGMRDHGISPNDIASFVNGFEPAKYQENPFDLTALFFGMDVHVTPVSPEQPGDAGCFHVRIRNRTAAEVRTLAEILREHQEIVGSGTLMPTADTNA